MRKTLVSFAIAGSTLLLTSAASAQTNDAPVTLQPLLQSTYVHGQDGACGTIIYDSTHASNQGAEVTAAANGPATSLADLVVLAGTDRFVCSITIEVFTLMATTPFDLTMSLWTDCTTDGSGNSSCGNGPGIMFPGSSVTVTGITPPMLGAIFSVAFPFPLIDLSGDVDDTISVSLNASRGDVFWRIGETPAIGAQPAGEPATSFVQRCGSTGTNNGCQRNFGVNNNFGIQIQAQSTPVELQGFSVE